MLAQCASVETPEVTRRRELRAAERVSALTCERRLLSRVGDVGGACLPSALGVRAPEASVHSLLATC